MYQRLLFHITSFLLSYMELSEIYESLYIRILDGLTQRAVMNTQKKPTERFTYITASLWDGHVFTSDTLGTVQTSTFSCEYTYSSVVKSYNHKQGTHTHCNPRNSIHIRTIG